MNGFPFADLAAAAGHLTPTQLAAVIGVTPRTVHRWQTTGAIPARHVDRVAVRLGHHPAEIWPIEWRNA